MEQRKWYSKGGTTSETYNVLYCDGGFIVVENHKSKLISFGPERDFGTLYGFPVNWSCLSPREAIDKLRVLIRIDSAPEYEKLRVIEKSKMGKTKIDLWREMIAAIGENDPVAD